MKFVKIEREQKMKKLFLILLLFIQSNAQNIEFPSNMRGYYDKPEAPLIGKVHSIMTSSYRNGNLIGDLFVEIYDINQRIVESIRHHAGIEIHSQKMVNLSYKNYFEYEGFNKYPSFEKSFKFEGKKNNKIVYLYESNRLKQELVYFEPNELYIKVTYEYNDLKKEVTINWLQYYDGREIKDKITLQYNEKNQWTKRIKYDEKGKINDQISFEYNKDGLLQKVTNCCEYDFYHTYEYSFDSKGNWIERKEFYSQKDKKENWITTESLRTYRVITYYDEKD